MEARDALGHPQTFQAKAAIITLPLGVLQSGQVRINPLPAAIKNALARLAVGGIVKVIFRFREPFWERTRVKGFTFMHALGETVPMWWRPRPFDSMVLGGWAAARARKNCPGPRKVCRRRASPSRHSSARLA